MSADICNCEFCRFGREGQEVIAKLEQERDETNSHYEFIHAALECSFNQTETMRKLVVGFREQMEQARQVARELVDAWETQNHRRYYKALEKYAWLREETE